MKGSLPLAWYPQLPGGKGENADGRCGFCKKIHAVDFATHVGYMPENPYDPKYQEVLTACKAIVAKCNRTARTFCSKARAGNAC